MQNQPNNPRSSRSKTRRTDPNWYIAVPLKLLNLNAFLIAVLARPISKLSGKRKDIRNSKGNKQKTNMLARRHVFWILMQYDAIIFKGTCVPCVSNVLNHFFVEFKLAKGLPPIFLFEVLLTITNESRKAVWAATKKDLLRTLLAVTNCFRLTDWHTASQRLRFRPSCSHQVPGSPSPSAQRSQEDLRALSTTQSACGVWGWPSLRKKELHSCP